MKKIVLVVGSGFSSALTGTSSPILGHDHIPTLSSLNDEVQKWIQKIIAQKPTSPRPRPLLDEAREFLKDHEDSLNYEQILSLLATKAVLKPPTPTDHYEQGAITVPAVLNVIIWTMCKMFVKRLEHDHSGTVNRNFWYHVRDVTRTRVMREGIRKLVDEEELNVTVVNFNYDGIFEAFLDTDLGTGGNPNFRYHPHVGHEIPIRPIENAFDPKWASKSRSSMSSPVTVLKPHGSLHFYRTRKDYDGGNFIGTTHPRLDLDFDPNTMQRDIDPVAFWDVAKDTPMVVPPIMSKEGYLQTDYFRSVTNAVGEGVGEADTVLGLGFSIPKSDFHFRAALDDVDWSNKRVGVAYKDSKDDETLENWEHLIEDSIDESWQDGIPIASTGSIEQFWEEVFDFCSR